jgi:starch phosphorylase
MAGTRSPCIAYLSMEIWLDHGIPTYSGGLGVLAGDTMRSAADLGLDFHPVTLLYRGGYFDQQLAADGTQSATAVRWDPEEHLERLEPTVEVEIGGRTVVVRAWRRSYTGDGGAVVEAVLLDCSDPANAPEHRALTERLYSGDSAHRLAQELVLGLAGPRMLKALGLVPDVWHMNEGHASFAAVEVLAATGGDVATTRARCKFTTHTPVPAGHDRFDRALVEATVDAATQRGLARVWGQDTPELNMTKLGLALCGWVNGVARRHAEVSREMFPGHRIHAITNGVHSSSWTAPAMAELFDAECPGWRGSAARLRWIETAEPSRVAAAHDQGQRALFEAVEARTDVKLDPGVFTIGFARRATAYKRAALLLRDVQRLKSVARAFGGLQVVYAGKAHPRDESGQALIREIVGAVEVVAPEVTLVYVPNYDSSFGALVTSGVDLWLNTPRAPMEASGTSGMKAVHNGVPNLSVWDGWWCEGWVPGRTGWLLDASRPASEVALDGEAAQARTETHTALHSDADRVDAAQLYELLEREVLPAWREPSRWNAIMRDCIAYAASYFNGHRMMDEYVRRAYLSL